VPAAQHAYYLDVQNKRPEYISTFVNELINWDKVGCAAVVVMPVLSIAATLFSRV
jgi:Iron/manganese superoxide dismutases, C-terminal domain